MEIVVNGDHRKIEPGASVRSLLRELDVTESRVAVERNRILVRKADYADTALADGDRIEVVTFVGGG